MTKRVIIDEKTERIVGEYNNLGEAEHAARYKFKNQTVYIGNKEGHGHRARPGSVYAHQRYVNGKRDYKAGKKFLRPNVKSGK